MVRWITSYISPLDIDTPCIEGQGVIKKAALNFAVKYLCLVVYYRLFMTTADSLLTWDGAVLIVSTMAGYDIDFAAIFRHGLHERAFGNIATLPFPFLV